MTRPIRRTSFTWNPDRESRAEVWANIKIHIQQELDRIHAEYILDRRIARRRVHPHYARNQQLIQAVQQGTAIGELARRFGLKHHRVREIIRTDRRWLARKGPDQLSGEARHPAQHGTSRGIMDLPSVVPRTMKVLSDP